MPDWPRLGRCGACGRDARSYPSGRWEHVGAPCQARSRTAWSPDDAAILAACRFVADGEWMPVEPGAPKAGGDGETVREWLAREAESRT